ncbi:MAG: decarboxylase [Flavobacteriaceae bacterium]|nr:decarboxylase [Flavobacteriaceae bacterium]OUX39144.1 MAG: decarboxylase [Flavobacteriaceae bacterium TMED265]
MQKTDKDFRLSEDEMRTYGYKVIDAIVNHFSTQEEKSPINLATRKEMDDLFLEQAPESATPSQEVLDFVLNNVLNKANILSHPKFYSFVPGPSNFISSMSDTLATGFNVFSGGWNASAAAAELEIVCINWMLNWFKFPLKRGGGIFTSGGSMANLTALVTARTQKCGEDFSKAVIYMSDQTHSSNIKAIRTIGFRKDQVRIIPTDQEFKISINKLKNAIAKDRLEKLYPFCIIANAGTTNTGTIDNLSEIGKICATEDIWMHVDAAYGGATILSKQYAHLLKGIEKADSITVDPHKWFFQPYEMGCLIVRNVKWLRNTFTEKPEYLKDVEGNESEINFFDHGIQLTRRFRALKFYMSIKTYGLAHFRAAITYNIDLAIALEDKLRKSDQWEIVAPASIGIINFRYNPIAKNLDEKALDKANLKISKGVMAEQKAHIVTTTLTGQVVLRMCLINPRTTMTHLEETISSCEQIAAELGY